MKVRNKSRRGSCEFINNLIPPTERLLEFRFGIWDATMMVSLLFGTVWVMRIVEGVLSGH